MSTAPPLNRDLEPTARPTAAKTDARPSRPRFVWHRSTLGMGLLGSLLLWAALPPLQLGILAWGAPIPWLILIQRKRLDGRRPYRSLYVAGFAFWLAAIHWLRLPHPATVNALSANGDRRV